MTNDDHSKKMNISDEQLDEWLASVELPTSLHDELMRIPEENSNHVTPAGREQAAAAQKENNGKVWVALAVAACYLILAGSVWVFWPQDRDVNQAQNDTDKKGDVASSSDLTTKKGINNSTRKPQSVDLVQRISERNQTLDSIEEKLNELRIRELEEKLARAESEFQILETRETASIVLAIADQTPVNFGASKESISGDMTKVIAEYPDSRGAAIASQLIHSPNW